MQDDPMTDYVIVNKFTGEELPFDVFVQKADGKYWEKAYAPILAEYLCCVGTSANKVLAYVVKNKDTNNMLIGSVAVIAKGAEVSSKTVTTVFKALRKAGMLKLRQNGVYMLSPNLLRQGSKTKGAVLIRTWEETP